MSRINEGMAQRRAPAQGQLVAALTALMQAQVGSALISGIWVLGRQPQDTSARQPQAELLVVSSGCWCFSFISGWTNS